MRAHFARLDTTVTATSQASPPAARGESSPRPWAGHGAGGQRDHGASFERLDAIATERSAARNSTADISSAAMRADRDGDGSQQRMHPCTVVAGEWARWPAFERADVNRDSRVSLQEATEAAVRHFDMADLNRDGTLTHEERQQMRTRMKECTAGPWRANLSLPGWYMSGPGERSPARVASPSCGTSLRLGHCSRG